jgi:prephenate dehydrogenase
MKVTVIGLGLIGGSMAIDLKKRGFASRVIGVDNNKLHASTALNAGIVDEISDLDGSILRADLIILAIPVDATKIILTEVLDRIGDQIVIDVSSTKEQIIRLISTHEKRKNFISTHPMAGTENSGPWAASSGLFDGKAVIFTDTEESDKHKTDIVLRLYDTLGMRPLFMNAADHDVHVAFVSHISHISSMALALTVLEKEKNEKNIFNLASGGFDSTVRLAKSSSDMWSPIFLQNSGNLLTVLETYIDKLKKFETVIKNADPKGVEALILEANKIRKVLN